MKTRTWVVVAALGVASIATLGWAWVYRIEPTMQKNADKEQCRRACGHIRMQFRDNIGSISCVDYCVGILRQRRRDAEEWSRPYESLDDLYQRGR